MASNLVYDYSDIPDFGDLCPERENARKRDYEVSLRILREEVFSNPDEIPDDFFTYPGESLQAVCCRFARANNYLENRNTH